MSEMKKDKKWVLDKLNKIEPFAFGDEYRLGFETGIKRAKTIVEKLDEPEKVVIPKFVADEFDYNKKPYWEVDESKDVSHMLKCAFGNEGKPSEFLVWVRENPEDYVTAVKNGYEFQKEKLYYIKFSENQYAIRFNDSKMDSVLVTDKLIAGRFTEGQIKKINPALMAFAEEVAE